jgi:hypothetical protein
MPGATPTYAFPYSVGADGLGTVDDSMAALALAVEDFLKGAEGVITSPHTLQSTTKLYRRGKVGVINLELVTTSAVAAFATIATIPVGFRPISQWECQLARADTAANVPCLVGSASGVINTRVAIPTATTVLGSFAFVIT